MPGWPAEGTKSRVEFQPRRYELKCILWGGQPPKARAMYTVISMVHESRVNEGACQSSLCHAKMSKAYA